MHHVLALVLLALAALPTCAQPGTLRFRQPVGDGYEVRIRTAADGCLPEGERLFGPQVGNASFEALPSAAVACTASQETLSLWHRGAPVDSVGGHRLWLGAPSDSLMWEGLTPEEHPVPEGAVRDLTGDGVPELLVGTWSGGAHCCYGYLVVSLGEAPRLLDVIDAAHGDVEVRDRDGDGQPELWLYDFAFAYWNTSFAGSPALPVALTWDGEAFSPSARHLRQPPLPPTAFGALVAEVRDDPAWKADPFPPVAYWGTLLDLLYTGRGEQAAHFAEAAWAGDALGRAVFLRWFRDQLWGSPYASAITEMNRDTVGWL